MKTYEQNLEANIWKFYLFEILYSLMFYTPIIILFFQDNGLSLAKIMLIQSIASIVWILMEIPSGYFADRMGRKISLTATGIFSTLSMILFATGNSFYHFLAASICWAVAGVFVSGADSALLYDTLKDLKREHTYKKIWGNILFCYAIGTALASIIGGILGQMNLRYPFWAMLPFYVVLIPLALSFHEPKHHKELPIESHVRDLFEAIKGTIFQNKKLRWLLIYSAIVMSFINIAYYLYQPYLKLSGVDIAYFGIIFAAFNIIEGLSSKYSHAVESTLGKRLSLGLLFAATGVCYILMGNIIVVFSFIFAFLFQMVKGFSSVVISDYVHDATNSNIRATILSVKSFIEKTAYAIIIPIIGWLVDVYTLPQTLTVVGIIVLISGGISLIPFLKSKTI